MEITREQINKILELASMEDIMHSNKNISNEDISEALIRIERKLYSFSSEMSMDLLGNKKVLIADDLELSIYQLNILLKKVGITPSIARHKDEAISEIQKNKFDCIILDLFIPDSTDGIDLIKTAMNKKKQTGYSTKIVVISGTDDLSLVNKCYELGIDFYVQKSQGWHNKLLHYICSLYQTENTSTFTKTTINKNIVSYTLKHFNDAQVFDTILTDINHSIFSGFNNVIFDLSNITLFDIDNAFIFAQVYKLCSENSGVFILVKPSLKVQEALSYGYLDDIIKNAESIEKAVKLIQQI